MENKCIHCGEGIVFMDNKWFHLHPLKTFGCESCYTYQRLLGKPSTLNPKLKASDDTA